jgi:hypothetical protein
MGSTGSVRMSQTATLETESEILEQVIESDTAGSVNGVRNRFGGAECSPLAIGNGWHRIARAAR